MLSRSAGQPTYRKMLAGPMFLMLFGLSLFSTISAQTATQYSDCLASISQTNSQSDVTFNVNDQSPYVTIWAYNVTLCTQPAQVPVYRIYLTNDDTGASYSCPLYQFDQTGSITSTCSTTKGFIATAAENGDPDWYAAFAIGTKARIYRVETPFTVTADTSDPSSSPSQAAAKRRRYETAYIKRHGTPAPPQAAGGVDRLNPQEPLQQSFICGKGASYCYTGKGMGFECVDTSTDVLSCGGCPHSDAKQDCSEIVGASQVECRASTCHVVSCDAYHTPSADQKSCIPNGVTKKRSILSYY